MQAGIAVTDRIGEVVESAGWAVTAPLVSAASLDGLLADLAPMAAGTVGRGGTRNILELAEVRELAHSPAVRALAEAVLGSGCFAVRGILFDKTPGANWKVIWHQDVTIAVRERREIPGFIAWSEKAGIPHVQAPAEVLERMIAVRVHLDDCGPENGPVRVLPGSHRGGRLMAEEIRAWKTRVDPVECVVARGGILAFRPLLLHASSSARSPAHRRVVQLEFAAVELPGGLEWHSRI